ncbi:ABC transporter permease [Pelagicoccus albus]|uniref:ABC transporter permease n=1 Tax=Pelagicoccus albus TaxID=415222 RepID=A0A7X1BBC7_9BACT|nr:ABC transporter permease [Pelagicoccus albus]MBC2607903.1 ABC transporter permease [Pelagicoccus albus]
MFDSALVLGGLLISAEFWQAAIRSAAPITIAATGEAVTERTGVLNIGIEGMMLMSAFAAVWGSGLTGSAFGGLALAALCGLAISAVHTVVVLALRADQILSGVALNLAALGTSTYLSRLVIGDNPEPVSAFESMEIPLLSKIPFFGTLLFEYNVLIYLLYALTAFTGWFLFRSHLGLRLRAVGENPQAVANAGFSVTRLRASAILFGGLMAGLAGGAYSLGNVRFFTENMTAGVGFVALALVIVARWNPWWLIPVGLIFGGGQALALRGQTVDLAIPFEWLIVMPYILTLVVYFFVSGKKSSAPFMLGQKLD